MNIRIIYTFILLGVIMPCLVFAKKEKKNFVAPKIILIKLPTYSEREALYRKKNNTKYADQIKTDAEKMRQVMVKDINDNFSFCTYYFFYDTNSTLIAEKQFDGLLLDKELKTVNDISKIKDDTTFQIVYYGRYIPSSSDKGEYSLGSSSLRYVIVDKHFNQLPDPAPNGTIKTFNTSHGILSEALYKSKLFGNIYYNKGAAKELNKRLTSFYE